MITRNLVAKLVWLLPLAWAPGACSSDGPVDIGHDVAQLSDYAANWDGYAEAATFPKAGSDRVRLRLDVTGEGTLEIGDAAPVPVPTQAEGGYLLDNGTIYPDNGPGGTFRDGFQYPVHQARIEAGRIRFGIDPLGLYGAWCAFAPPVENETVPSGYACGPNLNGRALGLPAFLCQYQIPTADPVDPLFVDVDCGIFRLCAGGGVCTCTATACGPHVIPADGTSLDNYPIVVDAAIDSAGTSMTGTLAIKDGDKTERITIRMTK